MAAPTQREALQRRGQHADLRTADPRYGVNSPAPPGASTRLRARLLVRARLQLVQLRIEPAIPHQLRV